MRVSKWSYPLIAMVLGVTVATSSFATTTTTPSSTPPAKQMKIAGHVITVTPSPDLMNRERP